MLAACFASLIEDPEFADPVDQQVAMLVLAESLVMWRKSVTRR